MPVFKVDGEVTKKEVSQLNALVSDLARMYDKYKAGGFTGPEKTKIRAQLKKVNNALSSISEDVKLVQNKSNKDWELYSQRGSGAALSKLRSDDFIATVGRLAAVADKIEVAGFAPKGVKITGARLANIAVYMESAAASAIRHGGIKTIDLGSAIASDAGKIARQAVKINEAAQRTAASATKDKSEANAARSETATGRMREWEFRLKFMAALGRDFLTNEATMQVVEALYKQFSGKIDAHWEAAKNQGFLANLGDFAKGTARTFAKVFSWLVDQAKFVKDHPGQAAGNVIKGLVGYDVWAGFVNSYIDAMDSFKESGKMPDMKPLIFELRLAMTMTVLSIVTVGAAKAAQAPIQVTLDAIKQFMKQLGRNAMRYITERDLGWLTEFTLTAQKKGVLTALKEHPIPAGCSLKLVNDKDGIGLVSKKVVGARIPVGVPMIKHIMRLSVDELRSLEAFFKSLPLWKRGAGGAWLEKNVSDPLKELIRLAAKPSRTADDAVRIAELQLSLKGSIRKILSEYIQDMKGTLSTLTKVEQQRMYPEAASAARELSSLLDDLAGAKSAGEMSRIIGKARAVVAGIPKDRVGGGENVVRVLMKKLDDMEAAAGRHGYLETIYEKRYVDVAKAS